MAKLARFPKAARQPRVGVCAVRRAGLDALAAAALGAGRLPYQATAHAVEVLRRGECVACHLRCAHKGGLTTVTEHLPERHRRQAQWTPERLVAWGARIGRPAPRPSSRS